MINYKFINKMKKDLKILERLSYAAYENVDKDLNFVIEDDVLAKNKEELNAALTSINYKIVDIGERALHTAEGEVRVDCDIITDMPYKVFCQMMK